MGFWIAGLPLWLSGLLLVASMAILGAWLPHLARRRYKADVLAANNEVAGVSYANIGMVYGILLAFGVLAVWEDFRDARTLVDEEAVCVLTLYRLADGFADPGRREVRQALLAYSQGVIDGEWPSLARGEAAHQSRGNLLRLFALYTQMEARTPAASEVLSISLEEVANLNKLRNKRIDAARECVHPVVWFVLIAGAAVTLGFSVFMATPHLRAQRVMSGLVATMIALMLFVIVVLDHPFTGPVSIRPEPLRDAVESMLASR